MDGDAAIDDDPRRAFLAALPGRLAVAIGGAELETATTPPAGAGIGRRRQRDDLRVGRRLLPSPTQSMLLEVDPPVDARWLCAAWAIDFPVAVSSDAHQRTWEVLVAGEELPDRFARRIAGDPFVAGRWRVRLRLVGRPAGELPDLVCGASPAYDVRERSAEIRSIEVSLVVPWSDVVEAGHPDATTLLHVMAGAYPAWRQGWVVSPEAAFVVLADGEGPVAGAAIGDDGRGTALAGPVCVRPGHASVATGSSLLDVLEAVALDRGCHALRIDASVFLAGSVVPYRRHGYAVEPPYAGDADVPTWVERRLA